MAHDHAHDHGHDHHHGGASYYYEQLFTIAGCGALAVVTLLICLFGQVRLILVPSLHPVLLAGGLGLLALVVIRAVALWTSVEEPHSHPAHDHDHGHDHDHPHDHAHEHHDGCTHDHHHHHDHNHEHGHDHGNGHEHHAGCDHGHEHKHETAVKGAEATAGLRVGTELLKQTAPAAAAAPTATPEPAEPHGHDHDHGGWAPLRFVVLFLPVVLFMLNLPNDVFSASSGLNQTGWEDSGSSVGKREAMQLTFSQFERAAQLDEETRTRDYEGKTITLVGRFAGENESQFTLIRYKINCCAADAQPLNAAMRVDYSQLPGKYAKLDYHQMQNRWVEVTGQIHFLKKGGKVMSALIVAPTEPQGPDSLGSLIKVLDRAPDNPYVN